MALSHFFTAQEAYFSAKPLVMLFCNKQQSFSSSSNFNLFFSGRI
jgi:hypothetical protein